MKDVKGYEGQYAITSCGKVWSYKSKKFLAVDYDDKGYARVEIWKNGKRKKCRVHRLVAEAYIPNPENKPQVNHLNEVKTANYVSNLVWATAEENINYGTHNERVSKSMKKYMSNPKHREHISNKMKEYMSNPAHRENVRQKVSKPVYCVELDRVFESQKEAAAELGIHQNNLSLCCNGKLKTTGGLHWRFATQDDINAHNLRKSLDELARAVKIDLALDRIGLESAC